MKTVVVCSSTDPAGSNIRDRLIEESGFVATGKVYDSNPVYENDGVLLVTSQREIVFVENLDEFFSSPRYIFISRHRAESGIPSLTAHFTGNFSDAQFGGLPGVIARYSPSLLKSYMIMLSALKAEVPPQYGITLEATHHGPTSLKGTVMFVELGSTPDQWGDKIAARCIAKALSQSANSPVREVKCAIAIGGTHYSEKFNKVLLESDIALGPIVPKYKLDYLDEAMLNQIIEKGDQKVTCAIVDSKGLGSHKGRILGLVTEKGLEVIRA